MQFAYYPFLDRTKQAHELKLPKENHRSELLRCNLDRAAADQFTDDDWKFIHWVTRTTLPGFSAGSSAITFGISGNVCWSWMPLASSTTMAMANSVTFC